MSVPVDVPLDEPIEQLAAADVAVGNREGGRHRWEAELDAEAANDRLRLRAFRNASANGFSFLEVQLARRDATPFRGYGSLDPREVELEWGEVLDKAR